MRRLTKAILLILAAISSICLYAQEKQAPAIKVLGKAVNGQVMLRWAPTTSVAWQLGNKYGYVVERFTVSRNGVMDTLNPRHKVVTPAPLHPLPQPEFEALAMNHDMAAIAAQALYGESFELTDPSNNTVQFINQTEELQNRFSFALLAADYDTEVARALALRWTNYNISPNEKYVYRVSLAVQNEDYPVTSGSVFIDPQKEMQLPAPDEVQAEFSDRTVNISWKTFYLQRIYTSYKIERSDDAGKTYKPVDKLNFLNLRQEGSGQLQRMHYLDSIPANEVTYYFRVRGVTPFGEVGPPSVAVSGVGHSTVSGIIPAIDSVGMLPEGTAYIHWRFPQEYRSKLSGFVVARSRTAGGPFKDITNPLPPEGSSYIDKAPENINYYIIKAYGKDGKFTKSFPSMLQPEDSIPPVAPVGLSGSVNDQGIVRLQWTANTEKDLSGYRVFRANNLREEYFQVTTSLLESPVFEDTIVLQTLTEKIYYTVVAYDQHENPSDYSQALELKKPDLVPPAAPVFSEVDHSTGTIVLRWLPSVSDDVEKYQLYRSEPKQEPVLLAELLSTERSYEDIKTEPGITYTYHLVAVDDDGLSSETAVVTADAIDNGIRPAIKDVTATIDRNQKIVQLQWNYTGATKFLLYRRKGDGPLRLYKTLNGDQVGFTDHYLTVNSSYYYKLKGIFEDGGETELSKEVVVNY